MQGGQDSRLKQLKGKNGLALKKMEHSSLEELSTWGFNLNEEKPNSRFRLFGISNKYCFVYENINNVIITPAKFYYSLAHLEAKNWATAA